jgi:hypothetical protein
VVPGAGLYRNLLVTNDGMAPNDKLRVTARLIQMDEVILNNVEVVIDMNINGAGGRDGGARAANTWYAVYIISDATGATVNGLFSPNDGAPTLPAGYTRYRRVSWARNNAANFLRRFRQVGTFQRYLAQGAGEPSGPYAERRLVDSKANTAPEVVDGNPAGNEIHPNTFFPKGVRDVYVKALININSGATDALWDITATDTQFRRLTRCASTGGLNLCETDTWITLAADQTFRAWMSGTFSGAYYVEAEGYVDDF